MAVEMSKVPSRWVLAALVLAIVGVFAEPIQAQCPASGGCCVANGSPGCDDLVCCLNVCANDPFCCDVQWDSLCASIANTSCGVCGAGCPGTGGCCSANATPGCDNPFCCSLVCTGNPFCCLTAWDALCAQQAGVLCTICFPPPTCPGGGDCCQYNGSPACDDATCCQLVCAVDEFCCLSLWDNICASTAAELCDICQPGCANPQLVETGTRVVREQALAGDTVTVVYEVANTSVCSFLMLVDCTMRPVGGGPVIASPRCAVVESIDPLAVTAFARCFNVPSPVVPGGYDVTYEISDAVTGEIFDTFTSPDLTILSEGDLNGDGAVDIVDLLVLLAQWGPCAECTDCPADLDGNCEVGITDLLIMLANWG